MARLKVEKVFQSTELHKKTIEQLNKNSKEQSKVDSGLARAQAEVEQQV